MKTIITILLLGALVWLGYLYFNKKPININLEKVGIARCEEGIKTMKFKSEQDKDNWYFSCIEGLKK